ncbi:hypothetical protein JCM10207_005954 [Rhodosporidiobolus poonsookiae]
MSSAVGILDPPALRFARSLAVAGLGVSAGVMATIPWLHVPVLFSSPLSSEDRLRTWSRLFDRVSSMMKPFIMLNSVLSAWCAYAAVEPAVPARFWPMNRKTLLALSALLNFLIAPYSIFCLYPLNARLKAVEKGFAAQDADARAAAAHETDLVLRKKWPRIYTGKVVLGFAALALAIAELGHA